MPEANTYQDVWIRWIHSTWENQEKWRTDISPNVLNDAAIVKALFVLDDGSCVFIPLTELRRALSQKVPGKNGMIIFDVNPHSKKVDQTHVSLVVKQSKRDKAKADAKLFEAINF